MWQKALCIVYAGRFFHAENLDGGRCFHVSGQKHTPALKCIDLFLVKGFSVLRGCHALKLPEQFHEMLFIGESAHGGNLPDGQGMTVQQIF